MKGFPSNKICFIHVGLDVVKNQIPYDIKTYTTIQEICDVLREVFREYDNPQVF